MNVYVDDQFHYGDLCRIKHLPTQKYLAVIFFEDQNYVSVSIFNAHVSGLCTN